MKRSTGEEMVSGLEEFASALEGGQDITEKFVCRTIAMNEPLSKSQQALRGRRVEDMTDAQLRDWIEACDRMEHWPHLPRKARRDWKASRLAAEAELERRQDARADSE